MATGDLFKSSDASGLGRAPGSGFLVTNHLNLMYMLAAGLVMPPAGFGDKYYRDTLECFPGWIPLFVDKVPRDAIESSTREAGHLVPVIVELDLSRLSGRVMANDEEGLGERRFPDQLDGGERVFLVPAPLPTSWIQSIIFPSAGDKRKCEEDAKDFGNVPLEEFKRRTSKALFSKAPNIQWPPGEGPAERAVPLERPLAAGGVMAMLLLFGNLGEQALRTCRNAFDPVGGPGRPAGDHPILVGARILGPEGGGAATGPRGLRGAAGRLAERLSVEALLGGGRRAGRVAGSRPRRKRGRRGGRSPLGGIGKPGSARAGRCREAPGHPRIPDGARRRHRERALRTPRYAARACHDAVLPAPRLRRPLRLPQRAGSAKRTGWPPRSCSASGTGG